MFKSVDVYEQRQNSVKLPTEEQRQEILQILNSGKWRERISLNNQVYNITGINWSDDCHSTARIIIEVNQDKGWERVSGYLVSRNSVNLSSGLVLLKHHSIIKDEQNNLLETMDIIYPLEQYVFICHPSALLGCDLQALYS
jgi:hypothetical protein